MHILHWNFFSECFDFICPLKLFLEIIFEQIEQYSCDFKCTASICNFKFPLALNCFSQVWHVYLIPLCTELLCFDNVPLLVVSNSTGAFFQLVSAQLMVAIQGWFLDKLKEVFFGESCWVSLTISGFVLEAVRWLPSFHILLETSKLWVWWVSWILRSSEGKLLFLHYGFPGDNVF